MKQLLKRCSIFSVLHTIVLYNSTPISKIIEVAPYYSIRSQGVDAARELAGWAHQVNLFDVNRPYGTFAVTAEYTHSFRSQSIARTLFDSALNCSDECNESFVKVSGSRTADRGEHDLLAENFYLPTDFEGKLFFSPNIQNVIVDFNMYIGINANNADLFFRLDLPLNWTRWDLGFCEQVIATGTNNYDAGYFNGFDIVPTADTVENPNASDGIGIENNKLNRNVSSYASGQSPQNIVSAGPDSDPVIMHGLCFDRFDCKARSVTRLADVQFIFGWNFLHDNDDYHLGLGLLVRAPTGNRPNACHLFEPISGNGGHWELGAHITSHAMIWRCESENSSVGFFLDANITHLFNTKQRRTFDLVGKPLSRYMLASQFAPTVDNTLAGGTESATAIIPLQQFANAFTPVANLTTQTVHVSAAAQGDLAAQITYTNGGWNWDLGYNFWGRSCEKFKCKEVCNVDCSCPSLCSVSCSNCPVEFAPDTFGLKGDAYVYGFEITELPADTIAIPLSATENHATITSGQNFVATGASTKALVAEGQTNPGVDNVQLAWHGVGGAALDATPSGLNALDEPADQTHTSINPILLTEDDIELVGTRGQSNKIYFHVSYNWGCFERVIPYFGIGAFGEFGDRNKCCHKVHCLTKPICDANLNCHDHCVETSLSQWGIWLKGGISF